MDIVALQSRKNGYSLLMASLLSWKSPVPKLGKTKEQTILHSSTLTPILTHDLCCVHPSFKKRSTDVRSVVQFSAKLKLKNK